MSIGLIGKKNQVILDLLLCFVGSAVINLVSQTPIVNAASEARAWKVVWQSALQYKVILQYVLRQMNLPVKVCMLESCMAVGSTVQSHSAVHPETNETCPSRFVCWKVVWQSALQYKVILQYVLRQMNLPVKVCMLESCMAVGSTVQSHSAVRPETNEPARQGLYGDSMLGSLNI